MTENIVIAALALPAAPLIWQIAVELARDFRNGRPPDVLPRHDYRDME